MSETKKGLSNEYLKATMEEAIERMRDIANNSPEESKATNAANALSGLITRYKDLFGAEIQEPIKMKAVKDF